MKPFRVVSFALFVVILSACYNPPPPTTTDIGSGQTVQTTAPVSESNIPWTVAANGALPVDERIYKISGKVVVDAQSLTRQTSPGYGYISGYNGYTSGYYQTPSVNGKSFVRLQVSTIDPSNTDWVTAGEIVIIKGTDTKMIALQPGDNVDFLCRRQAEAIAAIHPGEWFNPDTGTTWELDYCRMVSPVIKP